MRGVSQLATEPSRSLLTTLALVACAAPPAERRAELAADRATRWRHAVQTCLDTLIEHGRDRYGPVHSPLFMAVLDVRTLRSPEHPEPYDSLVRLEGRLHRRAERGANPWYDQATLRAMYRVSDLTGDAKYREAADACLRWFLAECRKPIDDAHVYHNGMPAWGSHVYWDCYLDRPGGDLDGGGPHEILMYHPLWLEMFRIDPERVRAVIDGIWRLHVVDPATGQHDRHDGARAGCDFAFSGGSFALAFAALYAATGEAVWLERARLVAEWHWRHRHPRTGLVADAPSTGDRYDATHCMTSVTGPHAAQLLRCHELTGDPRFLEIAARYIVAYDRYGWDAERSNYFGMLRLDGTPVDPGVEVDGEGRPIPTRTTKDPTDYGAWAPAGLVDIWRTIIFSYEFPLIAAQAAVRAHELSRGRADETAGTRADADAESDDLLRPALRWARAIEESLPPRTGRRWKTELERSLPDLRDTDGGTYAENYGRAISFFVHLARATGEARYLRRAEDLGDEALAQLFENGLFKGHPAKPYYEAVDGVGILLWALLELDRPDQDLGGAF